MPCHAMPCHAMLCYAMLCYAMLCYAMLYYAILCYAMLCYAMPCYAMLCYAIPCCFVRWFALLCFVCCAVFAKMWCDVTWPDVTWRSFMGPKFKLCVFFITVKLIRHSDAKRTEEKSSRRRSKVYLSHLNPAKGNNKLMYRLPQVSQVREHSFFSFPSNVYPEKITPQNLFILDPKYSKNLSKRKRKPKPKPKPKWHAL